jgi:hypothetical protein
MKRIPKMKEGPIIRAGEIGQYVYCAHAWWLGRVHGLTPANAEELALGRSFHAGHGCAVARVMHLRRWVVALTGLAVLCLMLAVLLGRGY